MAAERQVYSIKELNRYIRMKLDSDTLLSDVWIRGEISNFTHHGSGHMYFTLKDESSRIKAIMFASHNQRLPFIPKEGARVIARGNVTVYERDGQYQFYATHMQPDGIGSLYLAYEQLKSKLEQEGLFAEARKRSLPRFPQCIGVITSPTGAAVRDIVITLQRRFPQVAIVIYPVLVQGKGAAPSIVKAIGALNRMGEADAAAVRSRSCGRSMRRKSRERYRHRGFRSSRPLATRPTSRLPISPPTSARLRPQRPLSWPCHTPASLLRSFANSSSGCARRCKDAPSADASVTRGWNARWRWQARAAR